MIKVHAGWGGKVSREIEVQTCGMHQLQKIRGSKVLKAFRKLDIDHSKQCWQKHVLASECVSDLWWQSRANLKFWLGSWLAPDLGSACIASGHIIQRNKSLQHCIALKYDRAIYQRRSQQIRM
eukprot:1161799-Pelagomonas_calceolata.AAC.3